MDEQPQAPGPPIAEGEILAGKYKIERILGQGGMGVVVAAMHISLRQKVAIKFLLPGASKEVVQRFLREARSAARLKSDHVARVIDVSELETGAPYMVMEYLDGNDLSRVLRKRGAFPIVDAVDFVLQACEAIAEAHTLGIVHRDLKPANLFLTKAADGSATVKVLDFGISKDTGAEDGGEPENQLTQTKAMLGSPNYMSPEQMRSTRDADARADIWSLGVILYQLLTKVLPFKAPSFVDLIIKVNSEDPAPLTSHRADLPAPLEEAILRCLKRNPDERYLKVAELAAAISPFGRVEALVSAQKIARMQGAPIPSAPVDRPSAIDVQGPMSLSRGATGSVQQSSGALSSLPVQSPSIPPGPSTIAPPSGRITGSITAKEAAYAATVAPAPEATTGARPIAARRAAPPTVMIGGFLGMLVVGGSALALIRFTGGPARDSASAASSAPASALAASAPPPTATTTARADDRPPIVAETVVPPPQRPPLVTPAAALAATVPSASAKAAPSVSAAPVAPPATTPPPAVTTPPAVTPPPAATPPPKPPPTATVKRNPLDIDIQ
ncbi:MAG: serine/threonine-protein kinase [Minicystis sp.]